MGDKPLLLFTAPVGTRSGYGHHGRDVVRTLIDMDRFDIKIMDLRWGGCPRNALKIDNPDHQPIIERIMLDNQLKQQPSIHVHLTVPNEYQPIAKYNIGITAGVETTMCSAEWLLGMNRMQLNIVASNHVKNMFQTTVWTQRDQQNKPIKELRLQSPIEVLFEGADSKVYRKLKQGDEVPKAIQDELNKIDTPFNFLFVGHWLKGDMGQDRKDVGMLIKVFLDSFKNQKNAPGLILKTSSATFSVIDREEILKKINIIKNSTKADILPKIHLLHGDLTDEEMNALYNHHKVKAHITFTKGEGFGRPLLEASLSGKPIIASNWSGQVDFLNSNLAVMLPGQLQNVHPSAAWDKVILKESQWFTVNYNYASAMMKEVKKNYQKYSLNAKKLAEINKVKFTRKKMQKELEKILDKYLPEFPKETTVSLPNLPKLTKKGETIKLPTAGTGKDGMPQKVVLPKLKQLNAEEPSHGSGIKSDDEIPKIKLPKLKLVGSEENKGE
jgi:glycosyltransferase involved in cell wall biosynthesis